MAEKDNVVFNTKTLTLEELDDLIEVHRRNAVDCVAHADRMVQRLAMLKQMRTALKTGAISKRPLPPLSSKPKERPVCRVRPNNVADDFPPVLPSTPPPSHSRYGPPPSTESSVSDSTWFNRDYGVFNQSDNDFDDNNLSPTPRSSWLNPQNYSSVAPRHYIDSDDW